MLQSPGMSDFQSEFQFSANIAKGSSLERNVLLHRGPERQASSEIL